VFRVSVKLTGAVSDLRLYLRPQNPGSIEKALDYSRSRALDPGIGLDMNNTSGLSSLRYYIPVLMRLLAVLQHLSKVGFPKKNFSKMTAYPVVHFPYGVD
jgi:hypothetical protein